MLECLVSVIIVAIVAVIVLIVVEKLMAAFDFADARMLMLIRMLVGLLVLLYALQCVLGADHTLFR